MRTLTLVRLSFLLIPIALLIPQSTHASTNAGFVYTSALTNSSSQELAFSIRGNFDDIAATFIDADNDMLVDGFTLDVLSQGASQGSQTHSFSGAEDGGVTFLAFPIVSSNNFSLTVANFFPGVPAGALPLVPVTAQGSIVVTRSNGSPLLSIPLMIDPELLSDTLFENGFE